MKTTGKLIIFVITFLALTAGAYAQSPHEQLNQMVEQLQKTPNDNALREKIIKLASEIKPAPEIPEEARRRMAQGEAAFKGAKSLTDFKEAVKEFEQATLAAPWWGAAYYNLGLTQAQAEKFDEAEQAFNFYLLSNPSETEKREAQNRIYALSHHERLNHMVEQLQEMPYDNALREKIIKLASEIKPAPEIPEEARRSFIIGEALFKQAKNLRPAFEAANAFLTATTLAPWWSDAYWNLAVAQQVAGQYVSAKESLRLYLLTNPGAADRRTAQDRIYAIDADIIAAKSTLSGGLTGFWQRSSIKNMTNGEWIKDDPDSVTVAVYEIQQAGSAYSIKCVRCVPEEEQTYLISADANAIHFKNQRPTDYDVHECRLNGGQLSCISTFDGVRQDERYSSRSVCEIVGGPGIFGYLVLCK